MTKVYIIHENGIWVEPLRKALRALGTPFEEWNLVEGTVPIDEAPPQGVFYNRMSASSYTRDHRFAPEYAAVVLSWLQAHGRRIVNDGRALALEINKAAQYQLLKAAGVRTPQTTVAVGKQAILDAARARGGPLILKPNRGGTGDGVRLFESVDELATHLESADYVPPVDGISLVQEYIYAPDRAVTRVEYIGGAFFYAVRVDTSDGFELCPADVCQVPGESSQPKFRILDAGEVPPSRATIEAVADALVANGVEVAGVEFIRDDRGVVYAYDINTNTNYNADAEAAAGIHGMKRLAAFLTDTLAALPADAGGALRRAS